MITRGIYTQVDKDQAVQQRVPADVMAHYKRAMNNMPQPLFPQPIAQVTDAVVQSLFRPEVPSRLLVGWDGKLTFLLELIPDRYFDQMIAAKAFF